MLSRWKKEHKEGVFKGPVHESIKGLEETVLEQKNVRELRKRALQLEFENALLKKSMSNRLEPN